MVRRILRAYPGPARAGTRGEINRVCDHCRPWDHSRTLDLLDLFLIALIVLAAFTGFRRGALLQVLTFGGLLVGLVAGAALAPNFAKLATNPGTQALVALISFLAIAAVGDALGWMVGSRLYTVARTSRLAGIDAAGGSLVAVVAVLLAIWFVGLNLAAGPFPALARQIRGSAVIRGIDAVLPPPPSLLAQVRRFLNRFGFPDVFIGIPPAPGGPVKGPTQTQANRAFQDAAASTVRIEGQACGGILEGSGFVVSPRYVVTNAHAVAGVRRPHGQMPNGGSQLGRPGPFEPPGGMPGLWADRAPGPVLPPSAAA